MQLVTMNYEEKLVLQKGLLSAQIANFISCDIKVALYFKI